MTIECVRGVPMKVFCQRLRTLPEIARRAVRRADRTAFVSGERRLSYGEFFETVNGLSRGLAGIGVEHGDRVAILAANSIEWALTFWATVNLGAVVVGLNGWWNADEILYGLEDSGAKVLVGDSKRLGRVAGRLGEVTCLERCFATEPTDSVDPTLEPFASLLAGPTPEAPDVAVAEDDPAVILYTSGTTGRPKGAVATHRSWISAIDNTTALTTARRATGDWFPEGERSGNDVALVTMPFFHVAGSHTHLVMGLLAGWTLVLLEGRFDAGEVLRLIEAEGVTRWTAVPTMVRRFLDHPDLVKRDLSSLRAVAWGAAPAPSGLRAEVRAAIPSLTSGELGNAYGLTETSSAITFHGERGTGHKSGSVGRPVFCAEVRITDDLGHVAPAGVDGEVQVRGPMVFAGYWRRPEETADAFCDGWFRTGDVGFVDSDGFLYITDRKKDMIIRGGENVYCVEIEDRLHNHPEIVDAAVVGVPHADLGEDVKAVVQVVPGATLTEDDVRAWVGATLAPFKVPSAVELRNTPLPRNAAGKLMKNVLRDALADHGFVETL